MEALSDAVESAGRAVQERLEWELRGAWRAGYDWLHVYEPVRELARNAPGDFSVTFRVLPSHSKTRPSPDELRYLHSYDLRGVSAGEVRAAVSG